MGGPSAGRMVARAWILRQQKGLDNYAGGLDQGGPNAGEMLARAWILRQQRGLDNYAGGLDQGRYGRAKRWGNGSQSMDSEAAERI